MTVKAAGAPAEVVDVCKSADISGNTIHKARHGFVLEIRKTDEKKKGGEGSKDYFTRVLVANLPR